MATIKPLGGRDLGLAKAARAPSVVAAKTKPVKKSAVEKFQDGRTADSIRLREKTLLLHEAKMAHLANKKLKMEMAHKETMARGASGIELLRLQIQLETVRSRNSAVTTGYSPTPGFTDSTHSPSTPNTPSFPNNSQLWQSPVDTSSASTFSDDEMSAFSSGCDFDENFDGSSFPFVETLAGPSSTGN